MKIIAYTSPGCSFCKHLKELFKRAELSYEERLVGTSQWDIDDLKSEYPEAASFPYVIIDDEPVGGLVETAKKLMQLGLVSAPQK